MLMILMNQDVMWALAVLLVSNIGMVIAKLAEDMLDISALWPLQVAVITILEALGIFLLAGRLMGA